MKHLEQTDKLSMEYFKIYKNSSNQVDLETLKNFNRKVIEYSWE